MKGKARGTDDGPVLTGQLARDAGISRATASTLCRAGEVPAAFRAGRYEIARKDYPTILARVRKQVAARRASAATVAA